MNRQLLVDFWLYEDYELIDPPEITPNLKKIFKRKIKAFERLFVPKLLKSSLLWSLMKKYSIWDVSNIMYELAEENRGDTTEIKYLNGYVMVSAGFYEPIIWTLVSIPIVFFIKLGLLLPSGYFLTLIMGLQNYPFVFLLIISLLVSISIMFIPVNYETEIKLWSLICQTLIFVAVLLIMACFDMSDGTIQFQSRHYFYSSTLYTLPTSGYEQYYMYLALAKGIKNWIFAYMPASLGFGGDAITLLLIWLTSYLFLVGLLLNWYSTTKLIKESNICLHLLQLFIFAALSTLDVIWFYIFFEACLIPLFLLIGVWGSREQKIAAAYKLFFYTLISSAFTLIGFIALIKLWGVSIGDLTYLELSTIDPVIQRYLFMLLFVSFAVKLPVVPLHIWLPEAHVEAPTVVSIILAGILLKLGAYGYYRFIMPLLSSSLDFYNPAINFLGIISIFYPAILSLRYNDFKKIIAYSSITHMGLVTLILANVNEISLLGGIFNLISHGFISGLLFGLVGVLYDRYKSRNLMYYSGLATTMPLFAIIFFMAILANLGFPGLSGFISEFIIFSGLFLSNPLVVFLSIFSVVTNAIVALWLFNRVIFGKISVKYIPIYQDVSLLEILSLIGLLFPVLLFGIWPLFLGDFIDIYSERLNIIFIFKNLINFNN